MVLQEIISNKLSEFSSDPTKLNINIGSNPELFKKIIKSLVTNDLNIVTSFRELIKDTNVDLTEILIAVKNISMIKVEYMNSYDAFNAKSFKIKPEVIDFLGRYLIKRRATYLYIYMLLQQKNAELLNISKKLDEKFQNVQYLTLSDNQKISVNLKLLKELMSKLEIELGPENKELLEKINNIFTNLINFGINQEINYKDSFSSLGEIIKSLNQKTKGYKALVTEIIPLMSEWNNSNLH
jgi:hypothetical protein